jgi:hypothetical protein
MKPNYMNGQGQKSTRKGKRWEVVVVEREKRIRVFRPLSGPPQRTEGRSTQSWSAETFKQKSDYFPSRGVKYQTLLFYKKLLFVD